MQYFAGYLNGFFVLDFEALPNEKKKKKAKKHFNSW